MPRLSIQANWGVDFVLSPIEFKKNYLVGIPLTEDFTDSVLRFFLKASVDEIESFLGLKLSLNSIHETLDFSRRDQFDWGYMRTSLPVRGLDSVIGKINETNQVIYPTTWFSLKTSATEKFFSRILNIIPVHGGGSQNIGIYGTHFMISGASKSIPNYWHLKYTTGWSSTELPSELKYLVGILTATKVLGIISDALISGGVKSTISSNGTPLLSPQNNYFAGIGLGMASKSISLDGVSQSYSTYANGQTGIWGARLKQYMDDLNTNTKGSFLNRIYDTYSGVPFAVA